MLIASSSRLVNAYSPSGWIQQNSGCSSTLTSMFILDSSTIYVVGYGGRILKTTNGGNNWNTINLGIASNYWSVWFFNQNTGLIVGDNNVLIRTTNGGINWNQNSFIHAGASDITFFDSNTGYMLSWNNNPPRVIVSRSTDSGISWIDVSSWFASQIGAYFFDINNGFIFGHDVIYKTYNASLNWTLISTGTYADNYILNFLNVNTGYMTSGDAVNPTYIRKTTDGGYSWSNLYQSTNRIIAGYFINSLTGYIGGNRILKTIDGGNNWYVQSNTYNTILYEIKFINQLTGLAIGDNGIILKTTNGGETVGIKPISENAFSSFSLQQNYPNPFNPTTKIKFDVVRVGDVKIVVYDVMGREVKTLVNESLKPGTYEASFDGSQLTSGVYFYKMVTDNFTETKRMLLIK